MDVIFHENSIYISYESELQEEYSKEIQTLDYEVVTCEYEKSEDAQLDIEKGDVCEGSHMNSNLDVNNNSKVEEEVEQENGSSLTKESESISNTPHQLSSEDIPTLQPEIPRKQLPECFNRGIPKSTYKPVLSSKVKYPMSHYESNCNLSESNQSFVNQLSTISIPNSVQEALADPR